MPIVRLEFSVSSSLVTPGVFCHETQFSVRVHPHRVVSRHRHHCDSHRPAVAGRAKGPRGSGPFAVRQQHEADRHRFAHVRVRERQASAGRSGVDGLDAGDHFLVHERPSRNADARPVRGRVQAGPLGVRPLAALRRAGQHRPPVRPQRAVQRQPGQYRRQQERGEALPVPERHPAEHRGRHGRLRVRRLRRDLALQHQPHARRKPGHWQRLPHPRGTRLAAGRHFRNLGRHE